jgi:hypothetical protein
MSLLSLLSPLKFLYFLYLLSNLSLFYPLSKFSFSPSLIPIYLLSPYLCSPYSLSPPPLYFVLSLSLSLSLSLFLISLPLSLPSLSLSLSFFFSLLYTNGDYQHRYFCELLAFIVSVDPQRPIYNIVKPNKMKPTGQLKAKAFIAKKEAA